MKSVPETFGSLVPTLPCACETGLVKEFSVLSDRIEKSVETPEGTLGKLSAVTEITALSEAIRDKPLSKTAELRAVADEAELMTAKECWPFPTYGEILFAI